MLDIERQIKVLKRILNATDKEIHDMGFMLEAVREYGIVPLAWLQELDEDSFYTDDGMIQVPGEFASFCHYLVDLEVHTAIEVGVYRGRSSYFMCAVLFRHNPDLVYEMVDIEDFLDGFEKFEKILPCLKKCIPSTSDDYKGKKYDFVFIDADHSYDGAIGDYLNVGRFAKKILCFHDIFAHEYDTWNGGIGRCWDEVCVLTERLPKMVFSEFPNRWMGIGVVINDCKSDTIGCEGDYEEVQDKVSTFRNTIEGIDKIYVYGARNDSRRMYDALSRMGIDKVALVIGEDSENPENVTTYSLFKLDKIEPDATVVVPFRDSLVETAMVNLRQYERLNVIIADERIASFM